MNILISKLVWLTAITEQKHSIKTNYSTEHVEEMHNVPYACCKRHQTIDQFIYETDVMK